ncbi:N-acetyltransferase, partial [Halobacillus sp. BBL2006]|uniref:GNAT family N-acetyltransferase n=1 Tax=Halobacillus sp. BBL2006 TaxID=1543706 RepID=UPI000543F3A5
ETVIEQLWDKASLAVQLHFDAVKVACFESNKELVGFADRHQFELYNIEKTLAVHRSLFEPSTNKSQSIVDLHMDDLDRLSLIHPSGAYYTTEEMVRLSKEEGNYLWGFQKNGELTGYIYMETILPGHEAEICFVNVAAGERGAGIGSILIEHALQYAFHALEFDVVTISVRTQNKQAEKLYRQFGFREINTIYAYQKQFQKMSSSSSYH